MNRTFFRSYPRLLEDSYVLFLRWVISSTRRGYLKWNVKPGVIVPTFWFLVRRGCRATRQPKSAYKNQQNQRENGMALGSSRLVLYPVHGQ